MKKKGRGGTEQERDKIDEKNPRHQLQVPFRLLACLLCLLVSSLFPFFTFPSLCRVTCGRMLRERMCELGSCDARTYVKGEQTESPFLIFSLTSLPSPLFFSFPAHIFLYSLS